MPIGDEILVTKRAENSVRFDYPDTFPDGYYDLAKELNEDLYDPSFSATINVIAGGVGITETAIVMASLLLKDENFADVKKVNFLWSNAYESYESWAYTQAKTNDLVRTMMKEQGKFGALLDVSSALTKEGSKVGEPVPEADYSRRIDVSMMKDVFGIEPKTLPESCNGCLGCLAPVEVVGKEVMSCKADISEADCIDEATWCTSNPAYEAPGPEVKWLVVGSQTFVGIMANTYIKGAFGFDFTMKLFGNQPDATAGVFGIDGANCVYQMVDKDTVGTMPKRRPSPLASRETPYVLETESPVCGKENECGGCLNVYNCKQAGCVWSTEDGGSCSKK